MCGRMTSTTSPDEIAKHFDVERIDKRVDELPARYNVAPTQDIMVIAEHKDGRRLEPMRWGLVPFFSKDMSGAARMINARAEAVADKPAYRHAFAKRRCLIPVDGFYEWQAPPQSAKAKSPKQPWYFEARDGRPFAFAGLWEIWRDPNGPEDQDPLFSCTIITTEANEDVEKVHHRMPLVLTEKSWTQWLDVDSKGSLSKLLLPPESGLLVATPIVNAVNKVTNEGPELLDATGDTIDLATGELVERK